MNIIETVWVNHRGSRENMVAGDVLHGWTLDRAVAILIERNYAPLVGPLYVARLPLTTWQSLVTQTGWCGIVSGAVAFHRLKPLLAVYDRDLDALVEQMPGQWGAKIGEGFVSGRDADVKLEFAVF